MIDYIIIGLLVLIIILVVIAIFKNVNEGKITERLGNLETNTVKELASMVNSVDVEPSTVISTQPQTKYRLWNMLVLQLHLKQ